VRRQAGTDLGFCHPGHIIRNPLPAGPVDVNALFLTGGQRGHAVVRAALSGAEVAAYLNSLAGPPPDQTAWAGLVATEETTSAGSGRLVTDLDPARTYAVVMPELEWSKRFLRAASPQKTGPLAGRQFSATPVEATFTEALWRYLRGRGEQPQSLQTEAREISTRAHVRRGVTTPRSRRAAHRAVRIPVAPGGRPEPPTGAASGPAAPRCHPSPRSRRNWPRGGRRSRAAAAAVRRGCGRSR